MKLSTAQELFFPCGKGGESKAEVGLRAIPAIKKIASQNIGKNVAIVSHGGLFKLLNFYRGHYDEEKGTISIPHGEEMVIQASEDGIYLNSVKKIP